MALFPIFIAFWTHNCPMLPFLYLARFYSKMTAKLRKKPELQIVPFSHGHPPLLKLLAFHFPVPEQDKHTKYPTWPPNFPLSSQFLGEGSMQIVDVCTTFCKGESLRGNSTPQRNHQGSKPSFFAPKKIWGLSWCCKFKVGTWGIALAFEHAPTQPHPDRSKMHSRDAPKRDYKVRLKVHFCSSTFRWFPKGHSKMAKDYCVIQGSNQSTC